MEKQLGILILLIMNWKINKRRNKMKNWWQIKIEEYNKRVKTGQYGEVLKEWIEDSGWMDGVKLNHYIVFDRKIAKHVFVNESGVFERYASGGAGNITIEDK